MLYGGAPMIKTSGASGAAGLQAANLAAGGAPGKAQSSATTVAGAVRYAPY